MWRLQILGNFRLERNGERVTLSTRKVEALLAYLVLNSGEHAREKIAALFWGDSPDDAAKRSLRVALTALRNVLGKDAVLSDRETMQWNAAFPLWADARAFLDFQMVNAAPDAGYLSTLQDCLTLYRGALLADFYDSWLDAPRAQLDTRYTELLHHAMAVYRTRGEYAHTIDLARRALAHDTADEIAHQHLMVCHAALGDRTAALQQFAECERALRDELGVTPSAETRALYESLRAKTERGPQAARLTNLPRPLTSFIGRARELAELTRWLGAERRALVTLLGPGGSGKTRLAVEAATQMLDQFPDGVWWVDLAPLRDAALVAPTLAQVLGAGEQGGRAMSDVLCEAVRYRQLLIVLDNCEHVLDECANMVSLMLAEAQHVQFLATSREPLGIAGELTYAVPTLDVPQTRAENVSSLLLSFESVRLFTERARMHKPDFELTEQNALAVTQICLQLDGIPLALELAAARMNVLSVEQIALRLHDRFQLLTNQQRMVLPRQQTLRALIDWSHDLLNDAERIAFRRLAIFAGGWTLDAAEAILADEILPRSTVLEVLSSLIRKSLVMVDERANEMRYRFLETIQAYAREKMDAAQERNILDARHYAFYQAFARRIAGELRGAAQGSWLSRTEAEHENLRAALTWAYAHDRAQGSAHLISLASCLWRFWMMRGHFSEGERWLTRALDEFPPQRDVTRANALTGLGSMYWSSGAFARAAGYHRQALELYRALQDTDGIVMALCNVAVQVMRQGDLAQAKELLRETDVLLDATVQPDIKTSVYTVRAVIAMFENDLESARDLTEQQYLRAHARGDAHLMAITLHNLGQIDYLRGEYGRALELTNQAENYMERDPRQQSINALLRAIILTQMGSYVEAEQEARRSLDLTWQIADRMTWAHCVELLGVIRCVRATPGERNDLEWERAAQLLGAAQAIREPNHVPPLADAPQLYETAWQFLKTRMGDDALARAVAKGRALTPSEITALVTQSVI